MSRSMLGWAVAAVLAVVLAGVLVFQVGGGEGTRTAGLGRSSGQSPSGAVPGDAERIKASKDAQNELGNTLPPDKQGKNRIDGVPENSCGADLPPNAFAWYPNSPRNLTDANRRASQVYVATVDNVADGRAHVADVATEPAGKVETPTQQITLRIDEKVKGAKQKGETVTIESLGDGERGCFRVEGDPPYRRGEQYLLLLEDGRGGRPAHTISPEGRFRVAPDKILIAMEENDRMPDVARQKLEDVLAKLRSR